MWEIAGEALAIGEKRQINLKLNGKGHEMPAVLICGKQKGITLLLTAQIHGGEYNGTATLIRLAKEIDPKKLTGNLIVIPCVNMSGFWKKHARYVPEDQFDLNAHYPGQEDGTEGEQLAYWFVREIFPKVDFVADLHGGGMDEILEPCIFYPKAETVADQVISAAKALNTPCLIASSNASGECGYAAHLMGIPALLLERGYGGFCREEWIEGHKKSIELLMAHLNMYPFSTDGRCAKTKQYLKSVYLEAKERGLWYPAVEAGQHIQKGDYLGRMEDFLGNQIREYYAKEDGTIYYYTSGLAARPGDPLIAYGVEKFAQ